jgi:hypothetical protein
MLLVDGQVNAESFEVVDLSVGDHGEPAIGGLHRLRAGVGRIVDRQPGMSEDHARIVVDEQPSTVGTSMLDLPQHVAGHAPRVVGQAIETKEADRWMTNAASAAATTAARTSAPTAGNSYDA